MKNNLNNKKVNLPGYWSERYQTGAAQWDLGTETAVFRACIERGILPVKPQEQASAPRLWLPGCGYGHDAILFAQAGYAVTAMDFAPEPLAYLKDMAWHKHCPIDIAHLDIFDVLPQYAGTFDIVVEYTCFCAIDPARRGEYADILSQTLKHGGCVVALLFPTDSTVPAPPYPVDIDATIELFAQYDLFCSYREIPTESHPKRLGREELVIFIKQ